MEIKGHRTSLSDKTKRYFERMFYREKQIEMAVNEVRNDNGGGHTGGSNAHVLVSDPTAVRGIRAASEVKTVVLDDGIVVRKPERWLRIIKNTYIKTDGITRMILEKRFRESKKMDIIADEIGISQRRAYEIKDDVFGGFVLAAAVQEGIVKVY